MLVTPEVVILVALVVEMEGVVMVGVKSINKPILSVAIEAGVFSHRKYERYASIEENYECS
ncbi:hypothetical protein ACJJIC_12090 [Microbulbifer sp. ANSA002]|uniref:hypothetical protein n=1 Tax=unclassified Microbulbifer TaxID=2619833 RepID=UPI0040421F24